MAKNQYETDGEYDWIIKKEGGSAKLQEMVAQEKKTQPQAANGIAMQRSASKNLYDREERKQNIG